jgi:hypothetical protein
MTAAEQHPDVFAAFREVGFETPEVAFEQWLDFHVPSLGGRSPRQLIDEGDEDKVIALLAAIAEGVYL